jgi:hypothetical protein
VILRSCTSFLKTIANNRFGFLAVNGEVSYGGIPVPRLTGQEFPRGLELEGEEERLSDREGGGVDVVSAVAPPS